VVGRKLGNYEIVRLIGKGGMGAVYEGLQSNIRRRVAIKVLLPDYAKSDGIVRRFHNEALAVNEIKHPGVVQISDVGKADDGSVFLVMEFLEGETLSERLQSRGGVLSDQEVVTIGWQLADVLSAAHSKSIIHRDIKPGNIMLVPDPAGPGGERVKILDFGIAKLGTHLHGSEEIKTGTGQLLGTVAYMAPEQFNEKAVITGQVDVYALGCVLFRLRSGRLPFLAPTNDMAIAAMHLFVAPPSLQEVAADTAPWLVELIDRMLRKPADERPTMVQVKAELQAHLSFAVQPSSTSLRPISRDSVPRAEAPISASGDRNLGSVSRDSLSSAQLATITQATGQTGLDKLKPERRVPLPVAMGLVALLAFGGGALLMRGSGPSSSVGSSSVPPNGGPALASPASGVGAATDAQRATDAKASAAAENVKSATVAPAKPASAVTGAAEASSDADKSLAAKKPTKPKKRDERKAKSKGPETTSIIN